MQNFLKNNEWAQNPQFSHFWRHYERCEQWRKHHLEAVNQVCQNVEEPQEVSERLSRCEIRDEDEEMSPEMREFFEKTREHQKNVKHRKEAEERKEKKEKTRNEEYVDVQEISIRGRAEISTDHRDENAEFSKNREKMKKTYGEAAIRIAALESELLMKFETEYSKNPPFWPNIPFRF